MTVVHMVFVASGVFLALSDWVSDHAHLIEARTHALHQAHKVDPKKEVADENAPDGEKH